MTEWAERFERDQIQMIANLQLADSHEIWERKIAQSRGILTALKLLQRLPEDARAIVEKEARKA